MRVLQPDAGDGLADVEEELHREVILLLLQSPELPHLIHPSVHLTTPRGEGYFVYLLLTQRAEATLLQQPSDFIETELMFEVIRINHAAKVQRK